MIKEDVKLGKNVKIYHPELVNLYGCEIGDNTKIGAFVEIRKQVNIGKNCKIQAFAFIPEGVTVEDNVFIGPHVCFINDRFPRATVAGRLQREADWKLEETFVQKGASIGANATILCGVTIGKNAMVAAGSFVAKDVAADTLVAGNPARFVRKIRGPDIG
jgi:UDP-2-acetamido-3-amino-2,3-dideoxy-glucuronate N-acetyltransferase